MKKLFETLIGTAPHPRTAPHHSRYLFIFLELEMNLTQSKAFFSCLFLTSKSTAFHTFHPQSLQRTSRTVHFSALLPNYSNQYTTLTRKTTSNIMDNQFQKATSKRITSLFSREPKGAERDYSTKNRSKELKRLAVNMEVDVPKLKELLIRQRSAMEDGHEKARYVDWMLGKDDNNEGGSNTNANANANDDRKRQRKPSDVASEEKKDDPLPSASASASASTAPKKKRAARPARPVAAGAQDAVMTQAENEANTRDAEANANAIQDPSLLSNLKFKDIVGLNPLTKRALTETLKLTSMTEIQAKTFEIASQGTDVLGRARTGTGKTLAFLIPALESLLASNAYTPGKNVGVLIISPTRELATQIGDQATKLVTFHKDLTCQVMFGGTSMGRDLSTLNKRLPTFLVATPGRLLDHLQNTKLNNGKKFGYDVMRDTPILVLDETDRLLDMGFRNEINKILAFLPKKDKRQTLLFSATVPQDLKKIMAENMKADYVEVDCIHDGGNNPDGGAHTNALVKQTYTVLPNLESQVTAVVQLVQAAMNKDPLHKIVVFFPTARMVGYFSEFFNLGLGVEVIELHSKKSQSYRNKASDAFRQAKSGVLFTSDVSARGVDYPNVTDVIQIGLPESRDQYVHRLGRTGRAGKEGQGILVLAPFEEKFVKELKNIEISLNKEATALISGPVDPNTAKSVQAVLTRIRSGDKKLTLSAEQCYQAFLGYYRGHQKRTTIDSKESLVDTANLLAKVLGLKEQPGLTKQAIGKMGLKGIKNIRIISDADLKAKKRG